MEKMVKEKTEEEMRDDERVMIKGEIKREMGR